MANSKSGDVGNLQALVTKATYSVSMVRLTDYVAGLRGLNFFGPNSILPNVISIEIKDSLSSFFKTAKILIADQASLREFLPITGNEVIAIKYKNQSSKVSTGSKIAYFSIFAIEEVDGSQEGRSGNKFLSLTLIEFPAFTMFCNSNGGITFPNNTVRISDAADSILGNIPFINLYYNVQKSQETKGKIKFWVPQTWTPQKAFIYLQKYAISDQNDPVFTLNISQDNLANEVSSFKLPSMHFSSIYTLARENTRTYSTQRSDLKFRDANTPGGSPISPPATNPSARSDKDYSPADVILFKKGSYHDASSSFAGLNGDTYWSRDAIDGGVYFCKTYEEFLRKYKSFGFWSAFPANQRNGWGNQWSNVALTHISKSYQHQIEAKMINDYASRLMTGSSRMEAICYLNEFRNTGETAVINVSNGDKTKNGLDLMMGGPWLTWEIVDHISANGEAYSEVMYIRDSFYILDGVSGYLPKMNPGLDPGLTKF